MTTTPTTPSIQIAEANISGLGDGLVHHWALNPDRTVCSMPVTNYVTITTVDSADCPACKYVSTMVFAAHHEPRDMRLTAMAMFIAATAMDPEPEFLFDSELAD
ncbi:MAG: hypothetical protein ACR2MN_02620, partial [Acidimicrobiales bacterium]